MNKLICSIWKIGTILTYGTEKWGVILQQEIETEYHNFCKWIVGLSKRTQNAMNVAVESPWDDLLFISEFKQRIRDCDFWDSGIQNSIKSALYSIIDIPQ